MHTFYLFGWVKRFRHCNFVDKYNLIERSDLIAFGYDRSDPEMDLNVLEKGIYILW